MAATTAAAEAQVAAAKAVAIAAVEVPIDHAAGRDHSRRGETITAAVGELAVGEGTDRLNREGPSESATAAEGVGTIRGTTGEVVTSLRARERGVEAWT